MLLVLKTITCTNVISNEKLTDLVAAPLPRAQPETMDKTYSEKLKDPKWQKKRLEVMKRDKFKCCICKKETEELHVHHKSYQFGKDPWEYEPSNFQTLCKTCHCVLEQLKKEKFDIAGCFPREKMRIITVKDYPNISFVLFVDEGQVTLCGSLDEKDCREMIKLIRKKNK